MSTKLLRPAMAQFAHRVFWIVFPQRKLPPNAQNSYCAKCGGDVERPHVLYRESVFCTRELCSPVCAEQIILDGTYLPARDSSSSKNGYKED
jgi:hypothetical protein